MKKLIMAALVAIWSVPALAITVDLSTMIKDEAGKPAMDQLVGGVQNPDPTKKCGDRTGWPCLTVGDAIFHSLLFNYPDEPHLDGESKFKRAQLAQKVSTSQKLDLSAEDVALIKKLSGKLYGPWVVLQLYQIIDPAK